MIQEFFLVQLYDFFYLQFSLQRIIYLALYLGKFTVYYDSHCVIPAEAGIRVNSGENQATSCKGQILDQAENDTTSISSSSRRRGSLLYNEIKMKDYYVYIMGNDRPTLYIGLTNDLIRRVYEHKQGFVEGFTKKYGLKKLLYFEVFNRVKDAIAREKQLKHWKRNWKLNLIKKTNPTLKDLYSEITK